MQTVDFAVIRSQLEAIETVEDVKNYLGIMLKLAELSYIDAVKVQETNRKLKELTDKYHEDVEAVLFEGVINHDNNNSCGGSNGIGRYRVQPHDRDCEAEE